MKSKPAKRLHKSSVSEFEDRFVTARPGQTLIVGSRIFSTRGDRRALYPQAVGIDMEAGDGVDIVADLEERSDFGPFAHIDCLSVLEHSRRPWLLAANLEEMLESGGTLFVTVPFAWRVHGYPSDYWRFTTAGVRELFPRIAWREMRYASWRLWKGPPKKDVDGYPFLGRTEVCAFGVRQ